MSADGTINIDILLNKKEEFLNDVKNIDNVLNKLGENFGEKMDTSFSNETKDVENKAKVTKKEIEDTFNKPIRCVIKADSSDASKKIISTKDFLKEIPKEKISKLKVNNEGAIPNIKVTKKEIEKVPNEKNVSFKIKNQEAISNMKKVGRAEDEVKEKSTKLKDVLAGTFAGTLIANGISTITSKLHEALEAGMEFDKEQDTMRTVWKALTEEAPQDGEKLINFINDVSNHSIFTAESIDKMAQSFYHVHSNTEETERWTTSLVALGSTLHMTNERVSEAGEMFAKVMASGKAGAQDIYMMINRFPMFGEALQKVSGKTMEDLYKLSAQGKLTSEVFGQAMDYLGNKYKKGTEEAMTSMQGMSMYISKRWQQLWGQAESNTFNSSKRISKTIENLLSDDKISSYANALSNAFAGTLGWVTKVLDYIDRRKDTIMTIGSNIGTILGIIRDTAWNTFKDILSTISNLLDDTNENGKKAKDPLDQIDRILIDITNHKDDIEKVAKIVMAMWATKKILTFISTVKKAKDALMELKAVQLVVGDSGLLNFKGFKLGKIAKEAGEEAEVAKATTKLGKLGEIAAGGVKTAGRGVAGLDILFSLTELIGMNKQNAGKKIGAATGSIGGTWAGGTAGAAIGTAIMPGIGTAVGGAIGAGLGALGGTELGKKTGEQIQKGLKGKGPGIKKTVSNFFKGKLGWEQSLGKSASGAVESIKKKFTGAKKSLSNTFSSLGKTISKKFDPVSKFFSNLGKSIGKTFSNVKKTISNVLNSIKKTLLKWGETIKKVVSPIAEFITHVFKTAFWLVYGPIRLLFQWIEKLIKKFIKWVSPFISSAWKEIKKVTHMLWKGISDIFSSGVKSIKKLLGKLSAFMSDMWEGIKYVAHIAWNGIKKYILSPIEDAWEGVKKIVGKIWDHAVVIFEKLGKFIRKIWDKIKHDIITPIQEVFKPVEEAVSNIFDSVSKWFGKVWNKVTTVFGDIVNAAAELPKNIGKAISGGIDFVLSAFKDIANTMIDWIAKGVNGVLHGINWVLKKVHAPKDVLWDDWKPKKFAQGTQGKTTENQIAIINDAPGNDYQELVLHPDGKARIYEGRNRLTYLPKGSEVLEGSKTKDLLQMFNFPKYKGGTGKGILSTIWEKAKNIGENVLDFIDDPVGLLQGAVKKFINFGQNLIDPYWTIAKGGVSHMVDGIKDWFVKKIQSLIGSSGSFDGAMNANGVFQYLVDIATQTIKKFGMSGITSGYRPGDPYWHGKHQAIDIAYPSSMNGSSKYFDPANWVFENFADKVGYVITQGKVRDRTGQSGQPATGQWEPWPDNDHYDHLHITGRLGSGDIFKAGGGSSPTGLGAERWRSRVIEAAKMVGFPTDKGHIDRIIRQIQTESGGNERAVQGGYTDINTITGDLAKGLMQTISATFNAYKMPGHGNIFNGYDNILAGLRYIMARYGTGAGFFANIGMGHGYANGGWATEPSIFGEIPGQPEVAINPKRDSADKLIVEAIKARAEQAPNSLSAKINQVLLSAKENVQSFVPEIGLSAGGSKKILPENNQTVSKGDIHLKVVLDNGEIFKAQYPLHKAMEAHELIIEQAKVGVENG